jgi:hypothetical protein
MTYHEEATAQPAGADQELGYRPSPSLAAFRTAQHQYADAVRRWNQLPNSQARVASGIDLGAAIENYQTAAHALIADVAGRHAIEDAARVHLILTADGWRIYQPRVDGTADSAYEQPLNELCEHDAALDDECSALIDAAEVFGLPTVQEIAAML